MASTSSFTASSSASPSIPPKSYDVFLSFRGEDTRYNFTDHLYNALVNRGIRTFRDDKLKRGEAIAPELLKIIEESRSSIIVFSENYAHSRWCLDELVKIMECKKELEHAVFPIFYHVDPSHVRHQNGSFGKAFAGYEENWKEKVERWRTALTEAANLSGWRLLDGYESSHIKEMTNVIFHRLNCKRLDVGANLVGINYRIEKMIWRLHMVSSDVRIIGIYGVGGIGKTTIAKVLYNRLSCEFEYMSFLENIREVISNTQGLLQLQNQLLGDILDGMGSQNNINNVHHGANMIRSILSSKRVFVVLDDVDDSDQLEYLLGHRAWLGKGSRVIITTRNKHLLDGQEVDDLYDVEGLYFEEAYQLFSLYAFKQNLPKSDFINLSKHVVYYCQGLPLALKVLGSHLFKKTISEWESELHKLGREPEAKIHNVLKRSYDGLDRGEKNTFLDVACFFKDEDRNFVSRILDGCNFHVERGIRNLNDKCLITVPYNRIHMHDLIQQMGWEIVRAKFPDEPNKWSRLWDPHDIERAFRTYEGIKRVETISLDLSNLKRVRFNSNVFAKMTRLRLLRVHSGFYKYHDDEDIEGREDIEGEEKYYDVVLKNVSKMQFSPNFKFPSNELRYLCWDGYPLDFLPSNFDGEKLVELHLKCSSIKQLWQGKKDLERLKVIDLSYSKKLIQMSEFSCMSNLERLILRGCVNLIDIHPSVGVLKKLTTLNLRRCDKLKSLPRSISNLESLEILDLSQCSSFEKFPEIQGSMRSLWRLFLKGTAIRELPSSIDLESVERLNLDNCSKFEKFPENGANMKSLWKLHLANTAIKELPTGIAHWESLPTLDLSYCSKFEKFPENARNMKSLKWLYLKNTAIKDLPDSIGDLEFVEILDLSHCSKFEKFPEKGGKMKSLRELRLRNTAIKDLPDSIGDLESIEILDLSDCSKLEKFPEKGGNMKSLRELCLRNTAIKDLPDSIGDLESVQILDLSDCSKFEKFPEKGGNMKSLCELRLRNTAIKDLSNSIRDLESLGILDLSHCSKFEKFPEKGGNMKSLKKLQLQGTAIKDLPDSIGDLESVEILDLSHCSKFEKFPEKGRNMKSLKKLHLQGTAIKDLPNSIANMKSLWKLLRGIAHWESLPTLDLSNCSKFENFPENVGNMKSLMRLCLKNTAIRDLPDSIGDLESVQILDLSHCSKFEKFPEKGGNMKSLRELLLSNTAVKDLPDSIGDLKSIEILDLSHCSKFEKFPEKGGNMKSLRELLLSNTAVKDLPDSIGDLKSIEILDLSHCSKFEKFPEKGGNMKSLKKLQLQGTAIKDLPDSIGHLESLGILDLSYCSKFEKFPEKGGNMKSLWDLRLRNTAIKDLPDSIGDLEFVHNLDLSHCSKFEKFPEKGGNMKSLRWLYLRNTAIKDLPDSIGDLEYVEILDLSYCSKFEKFPEIERSMKHLFKLNLRGTAIEELPSSIGNLKGLHRLDIGECKNLRSLPDNIYKLEFLQIGTCDGRGKEDDTSLLRLCRLKWLESATDELKCWKLIAVIPESSGIPEWIRHQNLGNEVKTELPMNWYEDSDFLGFVVSCVYQPTYDDDDDGGGGGVIDVNCQLNLHGNGFEFKDYLSCDLYGSHIQVCVWWYPKIAIPKEDHHKFTHFNASFREDFGPFDDTGLVKKCGVNLIFAGDQHNHMPKLSDHHWNSGDNGSALQDTNGSGAMLMDLHGNSGENGLALQDTNGSGPMLMDLLGNSGDNGSTLRDTKGSVPMLLDLLGNSGENGSTLQDANGSNPMLLDLPGNFGDNGSVVLEESHGNRKRSRDDSLPHAVEEPQYKRLGAANNTNLSL